jgi:hypothetical protein
MIFTPGAVLLTLGASVGYGAFDAVRKRLAAPVTPLPLTSLMGYTQRPWWPPRPCASLKAPWEGPAVGCACRDPELPTAPDARPGPSPLEEREDVTSSGPCARRQPTSSEWPGCSISSPSRPSPWSGSSRRRGYGKRMFSKRKV